MTEPNYPNVLGRIESALGVAAPRDDDGARALAAIAQLKVAHSVSYENGQRLARMVGEQRDTIAHLTAELEAMRQGRDGLAAVLQTVSEHMCTRNCEDHGCPMPELARNALRPAPDAAKE